MPITDSCNTSLQPQNLHELTSAELPLKLTFKLHDSYKEKNKLSQTCSVGELKVLYKFQIKNDIKLLFCVHAQPKVYRRLFNLLDSAI